MGAENTGAERLIAKRNILVAVDDSDASERACEWAIENLHREGDELHFFHVIPVPRPRVAGSFVGGGLGGVDDLIFMEPDPKEDARHIEDAKEMIGRRYVPKAATRSIPFKIEIVRFSTDNDSIGEVLCKRAQALNAVAVVMASHNKGAIKEFFLGSVTKYATHHCTQPVLVLH